jgi:diphthamide synthase (EF-2-diphthine--ammonia ligase)
MNMAIDEAILQTRAADAVPNTLRFYRWNPSTVSIGRFQDPQKELLLDNCKKLGVELIMPLWDRPLNLIPGSRYRKRVMEIEQSTGVKAILSCIDQRYFTPEWLGRKIDRQCIEDMKPLVGPAGKGIDISGEPGEYHSTTLEAPLFKERIEITKYTKHSKVIDFGGSPFREGDFLYMDIEEAVLKPKDSTPT